VKILNEKYEKQENNKVVGRPVIWAGAFIVLVLLLSVANIRLLFEPMKKLWAEEVVLSDFVETVQNKYSKEFLGKHYFVNINGAYAAVTGRRVLNGVIKLNNGMLTDASMPERNIEPLAENIIDFTHFLDKEGIDFLYVQAPFKIDDEGALLPAGKEAQVNISINKLLARLQENQVDTLDLRPYISATPELVEENFSKTDHHWNYKGAFVAFQQIVEEIQNIISNKNLDLACANMTQWEEHLLKDWFLGSRGKRVGEFFAGVDDMVYYTPKFDTYMSCAVPKHSWLYKGDFVAANMRSQYLERVDYFGDNPYCLYIGGDYPLVQHRNYNAPNDLKVLMIKDSFTLPVQAYMSTLFKEIDVIDPRHFTECSIAEYVDNNQPDIVIIMINPSQFEGRAYTDFGSAKINKNLNESLVWQQQQLELPVSDSNYNYKVIANNLQYDKTYAIRFDDIVFTQGESNGVTVTLYDPVTQTVIASRIFDVNYCINNGGFEWFFSTPAAGDNDLQLLLYSGLWRATSGIGTIYYNVNLSVLD